MGFLLNMASKSYGQVMEGDYKGWKIGAKYATDNYMFLIPVGFGKMIKITKDDIKNYETQPVNTFGVANVKVEFKDGKRSLMQFSREGMDLFNRVIF